MSNSGAKRLITYIFTCTCTYIVLRSYKLVTALRHLPQSIVIICILLFNVIAFIGARKEITYCGTWDQDTYCCVWCNHLYSSCQCKGKSVPLQARCVPEDSRSFRLPRFSWHSAHEDGEVVSLTHRPPLPPIMFLVLIFTRDWVGPRAMVRSEGNMSLKNPVTPPEIDPGTVRLVAQALTTMPLQAPLL
jgi:hypothetical protein